MESIPIRVVLRHLSGARATEVDVVPFGAQRELVLGRAPSAAVRFDPRRDPSVGRQHARLEPAADPDRVRLVDLDSVNGTFVNGVRVTAPVELRSGDVVRLGADGPEFSVLIEPLAGPVPAPGVRAR